MKWGLIQFFLSVALAFHSDGIFDPPQLEERMGAPSSKNESFPSRNFQQGAIVQPILAGKDEARSLFHLSTPTMANTNTVKTVVGGHAYNGSDFSLAVTRYNPDGTLDTSFNSDGISTNDVTASDDLIHSVYSAPTGGTQTDGYFLFAGRAGGPNNVGWMIGRYNFLGELQTSFFTSGVRVGNFHADDEIFRSLVSPTTTQFVAAGYAWYYGRYNFVVAAFNTGGHLDTAFNYQGYNLTEFSAYDSGALSILMETGSPNRFVASGPSYNGANWDFGAAKYLSSGALDTSFHTDGKASFAVLAADDKNYSSTTTNNSGRFYFGGYAYNGANNDFALVRVSNNGTLDTAFHTDGKITNDYSTADDVIFDVHEDSLTKKVYAVGSTDNTGNLDVALARYKTDGSLDTSFHTDGFNSLDILGGNDVGSSLDIQKSGGAVFVGARVTNGATMDFGILRIHTDGTLAASGELDRSFGNNGIYVTDLGSTEVLNAAFPLIRAPLRSFSMGKSGNDIAILQYISQNGIDTAFDTDGMKTFDMGGVEELRGGWADDNNYGVWGVGKNANDFLVARFGYNGSSEQLTGPLETSFSTDGYDLVDFSGNDVANGITDLFVVYGNDGSATTNIALCKYISSGSIDTSFSTDGKAEFTPTGTSATLKFGKNLYYAGEDANDLLAMSISTTGNLNTTFHTDGIASIDFGGTETLGGGAFWEQTSSTKMFLVGGDGSDWVMAKILPSGLLDTTFHTDGKHIYDFGGNEMGRAVENFSNTNKIFVAGDNGVDLLLARLHSDGILDTGFTTDGWMTLDISGVDQANDLMVQSTGEICIFGSANGGVDFETVCVMP